MLEQREKSLLEADEKFQSQEQQLIEHNMKIEELQKALKVGQGVLYLHSVAEVLNIVFLLKKMFLLKIVCVAKCEI